MKSLASLLITASVIAVASPVSAAELSFLNGTIASHIPSKDLPSFRSAVTDVLNQTADNSESTWTSTAKTESRTIHVTFKPVSTVETPSAQTCRLLTANVRLQDKHEPWQFWFCKQNNGAWKASTAPK
jgi:hypothetical protein